MNRSDRTSPVTRTKVRAATQPPTRQSILSAAIRAQSTAKAGHTAVAPAAGPRETTSISPFKPYWVHTEAITASSTDVRITAWATRRRPT